MPKIVSSKYCVFVFAILLLFLVQGKQTLYAQRAKKILKTADASFKIKDYYQAAKLYAAVLYDSPLVKSTVGRVYPHQPIRRRGKLSPPDIVRATYQLAESYRFYNDNAAALQQYKTYLSYSDNRFPLAKLWYANAVLSNGDPQNAQKIYNDFLTQYRKEDEYSSMARLGMASSLFAIKEAKENPRATVTKNTLTLSADGSNFALEKISDSTIWFTSSRHEMVRKQKIFPVRIYTGNENSAFVKKLVSGADEDLNMGASSLSADGLTIYFTGWMTSKGSADEYRIYYMERSTVSAQWGKPVALPAPVNVKGYRSKQPYISTDGRYLFFSSDQPGTKGSYDIWFVKMNGKTPETIAVNAGVNINTLKEEVSPYYDAADSSLYFSSDGAVGLGGMDIYKSHGNPDQNQWSGTHNLGHPLNSGKNDLYYKKYKGSDTVYFSSDRNSSCCLEIFNAILLPFIPKTDTIAFVAPIPKKDTISDKPVIQPVGNPDSLQIMKALVDSVDAITKERLHINYNFASARIRTVDIATLEDIVRQLKANPELNIMVASFTDCIGSQEANINMSKKRSASVRAYLMKKGIDPARINTDFFAKRYFLLACREDGSYNKAEQIANRRSDLILTTEKHPRWEPSGKEVDANGVVDNDMVVADKKANSELKATDLKTDRLNKKEFSEEENQSESVKRKSRNQKIKEPDADVKNKQQSGKFNLIKPAVATGSKQKPLGDKETKTGQGQYRKVDVSELLEFVPKVKATNLVDEMKMRIPSKPLFVYTTSDSVRIDLYDNGSFDYDSLSVIYNKEIVAYKQLLRTNKPVSFYVKLSSDQSKNEMIFFAESLGITPPNSALMVITDGENKRTEVNISSDFNFNTVVYFIKVNK
jgi:outer membrane protein OmpA-like peptidoglycan-associated protein